MVASLWHQLSGTKVRLLVRLPAGVLRGVVGCGLAEEGTQTTTRSWYKPIVVHESTNTGRPTDLYRSLLPPRGGSGDGSPRSAGAPAPLAPFLSVDMQGDQIIWRSSQIHTSLRL